MCLHRVWYPDLEAVVARSDDIVVATVTAIGPRGAGPGGVPLATLAVDRNLLHDGARAAVIVFDMGGQAFECRSPLQEGQRVIAFLGRVNEPGTKLTHGVLDYLVIDGGRLRSMREGVAAADAPNGAGASFLSGRGLDGVVTEIVAIRSHG